MNRILIFGVIPPPYGGISIHVKRFVEYINRTHINFIFYKSNINEVNKYAQISFKKFLLKNVNFQKCIIHLHGFQSATNCCLLLMLSWFFNKKVIITIHNDRFNSDFSKLNVIQKIVVIIFYNNICQLIAVNSKTDFLFINENKITVIPAFIPPTPDETDINQLPRIFHQIRNKHKFLITANAFRISFYNNQDLYGIDLSIELIKRLIQNACKDAGFIYVIPDIGEHEYFEKMKKLIYDYQLKDHFHFYTQPVAYPAVINMCDLFIRPTNTDGYGVSIAEAISLKKPAIASDVCKRPEGTVLFKSRNIDNLYEKAMDVINNYEKHKTLIEDIEFEDNAERILEVYNKVLNEK